MKKIPIILMIITTFVIIAITIISNKNQKPEINSLGPDGAFVISASKITHKDFTDNPDIRKYHWYTDAYCDDCIRVHEASKDLINKLTNEYKIEIMIHPLNFLEKYSNKYSLITAAWLSALADTCDKKTTMNFMNIIYTPEFKNQNKDKSENDLITSLHETTIKAGATHKSVYTIKSKLETVKSMIAKNDNIRDNKELKAISTKPDKHIFVPFIYNTIEKKAYDGENINTNDAVLSKLKGENCDYCDDLP